MKEELEKQLVQKYPKLFKDYRGDMTKTCMTWGCECGDGWYDILENLCAGIMSTNPGPEVFFVQVKEKFGSLRVYVSEATKEVYDLIDQAERESESTCEVCGEPGSLTGGGWLKTVCKEHM